MSVSPWVIEETKKRKVPEQRPQLEIPVPPPPNPKPKDAPVERVVVVIQL